MSRLLWWNDPMVNKQKKRKFLWDEVRSVWFIYCIMYMYRKLYLFMFSYYVFFCVFLFFFFFFFVACTRALKFFYSASAHLSYLPWLCVALALSGVARRAFTAKRWSRLAIRLFTCSSKRKFSDCNSWRQDNKDATKNKKQYQWN